MVLEANGAGYIAFSAFSFYLLPLFWATCLPRGMDMLISQGLPVKTPKIASPPFMAEATKIRVIKGIRHLMLLPKCTIILASDHPVNKIFESRNNHLMAARLYPQATKNTNSMMNLFTS